MNNIYEMEKLLNKLIEKGWKPFDMEAIRIEYSGGPEFLLRYKGRNKNGEGWNVRNLVSKESGLRQFVCENGMVKKLGDNFKYFYNSRDNKSTLRYYEDRYKYWLLESSLKDESELEQFLLENIKVE